MTKYFVFVNVFVVLFLNIFLCEFGCERNIEFSNPSNILVIKTSTQKSEGERERFFLFTQLLINVNYEKCILQIQNE